VVKVFIREAGLCLVPVVKVFIHGTGLCVVQVVKVFIHGAGLCVVQVVKVFIYGAGLCVVQVVKVFILPVLRAEADRLQSVLEGPLGNNTDRIAADHVRAALLVSITVSHVSACHDVKQSSIPTPLQTSRQLAGACGDFGFLDHET